VVRESLDTMSIKLDQMNDTMKILMDEEHNLKDGDEETIY
jgi:hypothetical protein